MSLILGVHLPKKLYLVSDTRVTTKYKNGKKKFEDDFIKLFSINRRISALEAGSASPAAFILKKLKKEVGEHGSFDNLKEIVNYKLKQIVSEYVNKTGLYGDVALIFAGYNPNKQKKIDCVALGDAMSADLVSRGEGSFMNQSIDNDIKVSLVKAIVGKGKLGKGDLVEIQNTTDSGMISIEIDIKNNKYKMEEINCYDYVVFHPNQSFRKIKLPKELISQIEFGNKKSSNWQDILYDDSEKLLSFVNKEIVKNNFETVGGNLFIGLATQNNYFIYPTGDLATIKDGKIVMSGSIYNKNGDIYYKLKNGKEGKYRFIKDLSSGDLKLLNL